MPFVCAKENDNVEQQLQFKMVNVKGCHTQSIQLFLKM